jgi:hypothetical protein
MNESNTKLTRVKKFAKTHATDIAFGAAAVGIVGCMVVAVKRQAAYAATHSMFYAVVENELCPTFGPKFAALLNEFEIPHNVPDVF